MLIFLATLGPAIGQEAPVTIRVEVRTDSAPVAGATVKLNGVAIETDPNGVAIATINLGKVNVIVTKEGYLPATVSLSVDQVREWQVVVELQPQPNAQQIA